MPFMSVERKGRIRREGGQRLVPIPEEFVLEGDDVTIVQDEWGEMRIHPASPEGLKALDRFGPFADWEDDEDADG